MAINSFPKKSKAIWYYSYFIYDYVYNKILSIYILLIDQ